MRYDVRLVQCSNDCSTACLVMRNKFFLWFGSVYEYQWNVLVFGLTCDVWKFPGLSPGVIWTDDLSSKPVFGRKQSQCLYLGTEILYCCPSATTWVSMAMATLGDSNMCTVQTCLWWAQHWSSEMINPTLHDRQIRSIWLILLNVDWLCLWSLWNESRSISSIWMHMNTYARCQSIDAMVYQKMLRALALMQYENKLYLKSLGAEIVQQYEMGLKCFDLLLSNWNSSWCWCDSIICFDVVW